VEAFSAKFSMTLAAKLLTGPTKFEWWNYGTDYLYHHAKFDGNRITHVGVTVHDVFFYFLKFVNHGSRLTVPVTQLRYSTVDAVGICRPI